MANSRTSIAAMLTLGLFVAGSMSSCKKTDDTVTTDYSSKKTSADKLMSEIATSSTTMKADHQKWMSDLDAQASKAKSDTSKINGFKQDIRKLDEDWAKVATLQDSVKLYENAPTDNADKMKAANDRLGANFDDLSSKWKSLVEDNGKLQGNIQTFLAADAGKAMKADSGKTTTTVKTPEKTVQHPTHSTTTSTTTTTTTTPTTNTHETKNHTPGLPRNSGK
jgi:hypothetical protein